MYMDFCGFTFNGHHSSEMGFIRVSDGNRYNENLVPDFQDKTVQIPGGDGVYFFNSFYNKRIFTINIAFDSMTESQLRLMRQVFNGKDVGELIFDECPYKAYSVKVQSAPQLKYVCFDEPNVPDASDSNNIIHINSMTVNNIYLDSITPRISTHRVYKGEGTIQFTTLYPYARSIYKYLNLYENDTQFPEGMFANINEWKEASGMLAAQGIYDTYVSSWPGFLVYNPGDVETDFKIYYAVNSELKANGLTIGLAYRENNSNETIYPEESQLELDFSDFSSDDPRFDTENEEVAYICINSKTNLIEGCNAYYQPNGMLYNDAILGGNFFKIPLNNDGTIMAIASWDQNSHSVPFDTLLYDYLYY